MYFTVKLSNFGLIWFIFIINLCRIFSAIFEKKVLDHNGPYIKFQTNLRNVCLPVNFEFCLSLVGVGVGFLASAHTRLCKGLAYLPKVRYIIVVDFLLDDFLIFETVFLGRSATLP